MEILADWRKKTIAKKKEKKTALIAGTESKHPNARQLVIRLFFSNGKGVRRVASAAAQLDWRI